MPRRFAPLTVPVDAGEAHQEHQTTIFERLDSLARRAEVRDPRGPAVALFCVTLALAAFGLLVQASHAATTVSPEGFRAELVSQTWFRVVGLAVLLVAARIGPAGLRRYVPALTVVMAILLVLVFVPPFGMEKNGSNRWLSLRAFGVPGISFQPSELARIVVVMWIADRCGAAGPAGARRLARRDAHARPGAGVLLAGGGGDRPGRSDPAPAVRLRDHVGRRSSPDPRVRHLHHHLRNGADHGVPADPLRAAAHRDVLRLPVEPAGGRQHRRHGQRRSLRIGYTHGVFRNRGVPYLDSDFVFAQVGEEFGLFGMLLLIGLLCAFLWFGLRLVLSLRDRYEALACFGLLVSTALQAMLHVQIVAGLAPPKGMTLPFVSDGGTSLVVSCLAVGLAIGAARRSAPT